MIAHRYGQSNANHAGSACSEMRTWPEKGLQTPLTCGGRRSAKRALNQEASVVLRTLRPGAAPQDTALRGCS